VPFYRHEREAPAGSSASFAKTGKEAEITRPTIQTAEREATKTAKCDRGKAPQDGGDRAAAAATAKADRSEN